MWLNSFIDKKQMVNEGICVGKWTKDEQILKLIMTDLNGRRKPSRSACHELNRKSRYIHSRMLLVSVPRPKPSSKFLDSSLLSIVKYITKLEKNEILWITAEASKMLNSKYKKEIPSECWKNEWNNYYTN